MIMVKEKQRGYWVTFLVGNVECLKCLDNGKRNRKYGIKPGIKDQNIKKSKSKDTREKFLVLRPNTGWHSPSQDYI